jgi:RNA polymerase sigma factor (TIGR02999 family)
MKNERTGHTLQATALVNDLYLRLVDISSTDWKDRAHFFAVCAQMMRRILVDSARARGSRKRGGGAVKINVEDAPVMAPDRDAATVALDDALQALAAFDSRKARVIELRYFGGLSVEEAAEVLNISPQSVMRDWKLAKAWLTRELAHH